jgi:predicted AlkP superfamily pyrophosphatase or phosphodiesterase
VRRFIFLFTALFITSYLHAAGKAEHVVVIVWDGMRPDFISQEHTPTLWQMARDGVMFTNQHAVYPSSTEVNGTAIATGAYPGHDGIMANKEYRPAYNLFTNLDTQDIHTMRMGDELSHGHYILFDTVAETLQAAGKTTAIAGSKPVAQLHDRRDRTNDTSSVVFEGKSSPESLQSTLTNLLGQFPASEKGESPLPNEKRDEWSTHALTDVLWSNNVPAYSLLWLCDPDFSQHPAGLGAGKSLAAIESCDRKLAEVFAALDKHHLRDKTDVFVVSDHGFSSITRRVSTCDDLKKAGFDAYRAFTVPPKPGQIMVNGVGGSVLFYVIGHDAGVIQKLVTFLQHQDYAGVIFTQKKLPGTFTLSDVEANSSYAPDVLLSMRWSSGQSDLGVPGLLTLDSSSPGTGTILGSHASLSHFDMHNTLVGIGPDLKSGFIDTYPTGNTDLAPTILWLLGVKPTKALDGRVLGEALTGPAPKVGEPKTYCIEATTKAGDSTWSQYLQISRMNHTLYFDEGNASSSTP